MNYLKRITLILLLFLIIALVVSLFLPSSFHLERKININADKDQIFKQIEDLKNWKNWSSWELKDTTIFNNKEAFSNPSNGIGATFSWESDNQDLSSGKVEIIKSISNEYIENQIDYGGMEVQDIWRFSDIENGVEVTWSIDIDFGFNPFSKFSGLFMEKQISPDFDLGLKRLKLFVENLPKIHLVEVKKEKIEKDIWFLSIRDTVTPFEMNNIHGKIYEKLNNYIDSNGIESLAAPIVIYHDYSKTIIDIEGGIPIKDSITVFDREIKLNKINAGYVVTAIHYGPYDRIPETYFGINEWMRKNKVTVTGPPWESYLTDPATESNPEKWQTAIYFPIQ